MTNRRMEFLIGMTVVVIFVAVSVMTILFGPEQGIFVHGGGKRMTIVFDKANGITNTSKVVKSGVEIGRVYKRELTDDADKSAVRVSFELNPGVRIYSNEYARINRNLLGDAAIEFVKNANFTGEITEIGSEQLIVGQPGADISGTVSNIEGDLAKTLEQVQSAAAGITLFMDNVNHFLGTPEEVQQKKNRLQNVFNELSQTLQSINGLAANMNEIMSDKALKDNIRTGAKEIPNILAKVNELMGNANSLAQDFRSTLERTHRGFDQVEKNLDNLGRFTSSLAEDGPDLIASLSDSSKDIRRMVGNISQLAEQLNHDVKDPHTTLGMLGDPEVAASIRGIVANAEEISLKMQPIMDDARVFTNKIAHRPSSLVFDSKNYKGLTGGAENAVGLQSLSPSGGTSSSLYRLTSGEATTSSTLPPALSGSKPADGSLYNPDDLAGWYRQYPQTVAKKSPSCLDGLLDKVNFSICSRSKEPKLDMESPLGTTLSGAANDPKTAELEDKLKSNTLTDKSRAAKESLTPPDVRQIDKTMQDEATLKERGRRRWLPLRRRDTTSTEFPIYGNVAMIDGQEVSFGPGQSPMVYSMPMVASPHASTPYVTGSGPQVLPAEGAMSYDANTVPYAGGMTNQSMPYAEGSMPYDGNTMPFDGSQFAQGNMPPEAYQ
ncbi:MAG: MlaD family protein, partial [Planctomycetia bacterium]|nr:MlaD family protein [Planctomycetia bacterium]